MKKYFLAIIVSIFSLISFANPVYIPESYMEYLKIKENNDWEMRLMISVSIDSIKIYCSRGSSLWNRNGYPNYQLLFLNNDSLTSDLYFRFEGDSVSIISYYINHKDLPDSIVETFVYGDHTNSTMPAPTEGQSIVRFLENYYSSDYHCLCDSSGREKGTVQGHIYDNKDNLVTSGSFALSPFPIKKDCIEGSFMTDGFDINNDGSYTASLYAMHYKINKIKECTRNEGWNCIYYTMPEEIEIDSLDFTVEPGSNIEMDIHLIGGLVGVNEYTNNNPYILKIFPNPVSNGLLQYEISTPVRSTSCFLKLIGMNGMMFENYKINDPTGKIQLPSGIPDGSYIIQLLMNKKVYTSLPLILSVR